MTNPSAPSTTQEATRILTREGYSAAEEADRLAALPIMVNPADVALFASDDWKALTDLEWAAQWEPATVTIGGVSVHGDDAWWIISETERLVEHALREHADRMGILVVFGDPTRVWDEMPEVRSDEALLERFWTALDGDFGRGLVVEVARRVPVGTNEIAERAGVSIETVRTWRKRHRGFPRPVRELTVGPLWWWHDVAAWLAVPRPVGRPAAS